MDSRTILKSSCGGRLDAEACDGSHHHYKHPIKPGIVTVPHPKKDIPFGTLKSVEKQARLKLR
jgi:predicted RNA binding protein YcfA (HicA-like mRNA interferase family)